MRELSVILSDFSRLRAVSVPGDWFELAAMRPATAPVFHYTSSTGLIGMARDRCVWASEASSLNDVAEVRQGWTLIRSVLRKMSPSEVRDDLLEPAKWMRSEQNEVFVLSGSTQRDDANQWRNYGDAGRGYVVEFDPTVHLAVLSDQPEPDVSEPERPGRLRVDFAGAVWVTPWRHVIYEREIVKEAVEQIVERAEALRGWVDDAPDEESHYFRRDDLRNEAWSAASALAHLVKAPGFAGENEVRVVATAILPAAHLQHRPSPRGVVSYFRLTRSNSDQQDLIRRNIRGSDWPTPPSLPLRSVRLGPVLSMENGATVERMLQIHGFGEVDVQRSRVPLR